MIKTIRNLINVQGVDNFIKNHYSLIIFLIIVVGIFLRFYNFFDLLSFGADTTRDISIAREAIERRELPLMGSFSSAGPFVFGPLFYWFLVLSYLVLPFGLFSPWILIGIVSVLVILAMAYLGRLIAGFTFSVILAALVATSPQLVSVSLSLTQHTLVIISAVFVLLFITLYWQRQNFLFSFLAGFFLGIALSMHWQSLNLSLFLPLIILAPVAKLRSKIIAFVVAIVGVLIVNIPLLIWDSRQDWANIRNLLDYLLVVQFRRYVPSSWRLFIFDYFPTIWASSTTGFKISGFILIIMAGISFLYFSLKKKIESPLFSFGLVFFILSLLNRYYKGERFEGYLFYFTPLVLVFSAWIIYKFLFSKAHILGFNFKFSIGLVIFAFIIFENLYVLKSRIFLNFEKSQLESMKETANLLKRKYPDRGFTLYEYKKADKNALYSLSVFLEGLEEKDNKRILLGLCSFNQCPFYLAAVTSHDGSTVVRLNDIDFFDPNWHGADQAAIYDELIGWLTAGNLQANFDLGKYVLQELKLAD